MPAATSGGRRRTEFACRPDAAPSGGPAEALAPAPRIRFEPRPGGRPGLAATADVAMAMYGPDGAARAGLPGWRTPLCSCRRPLQFQGQGDRRQAIRQLVTGADGVG